MVACYARFENIDFEGALNSNAIMGHQRENTSNSRNRGLTSKPPSKPTDQIERTPPELTRAQLDLGHRG